MSAFRLRLSQLAFIVSFCAFVFMSCNSSRHMAGFDFQHNRNYSKSMEKHHKIQKNRKRGSIKCNDIKVSYINQDNKGTVNPEIVRDKSDFTLIILKEQDKHYNPGIPNLKEKQE